VLLAVATLLLALLVVSRYPWVILAASLALLASVSWWVGWRVYRWRRRVALRREAQEARYRHLAGLRASGIGEIDRWVAQLGRRRAGHLFEDRLEAMFSDLGCDVERVGRGGGDYGTDLIVRWGQSVDEAMALHARLYDRRARHQAGSGAVMQALAGARHRGIPRACVVTNVPCSPTAQVQAQGCGVRLIERDELVKLLVLAEKAPASRPASGPTQNEEAPPPAPARPRPEEAPDRDPGGLYRTLQVDPRADVEVMEAAWRRLAQLYHPDGLRPDLPRMQAINRAHDVLGDPRQRAEYDRSGVWA
jgi:Restriction endonuclease/DnaJ domain